MPDLGHLVDDVYAVLQRNGGGSSPSTLADSLAKTIEKKVGETQTARLRPSNLGETCLRKIWYEIHTPEAVEPFDSVTLLKFLVGNTWEEILLFLAKEAGHEVSNEQTSVSMHGITGSIDCILDGHLVDVKSASPYAFDKYMAGISLDDDPFGYIHQANFYLDALILADNPALKHKDNAYLFVGDKTTGRLGLAKVPRLEINWEKYIGERLDKLNVPRAPARAYSEIEVGKSGNMGIPNTCNKWCRSVDICWPNTRKFVYSDGVKRLTKVVKTPNVTEVNT